MPPEQVIQPPSIQAVFLRMTVRDQELANGTGFLVDGPDGQLHLVTNWHNLAGRHAITMELLSETTGATPDAVRMMLLQNGHDITWGSVECKLKDEDGQPLWKEHPVHGSLVDVACIPIELPPAFTPMPYPWEPLQDIRVSVGDDVSVTGFPFARSGGGFFAIWTRATLATEPAFDLDGLPMFLVDARTRRGQSGSPVVFHRSSGIVGFANGDQFVIDEPVTRLVGIYSGKIGEETDLGRVFRADAVAEVLRSGVTPTGL